MGIYWYTTRQMLHYDVRSHGMVHSFIFDSFPLNRDAVRPTTRSYRVIPLLWSLFYTLSVLDDYCKLRCDHFRFAWEYARTLEESQTLRMYSDFFNGGRKYSCHEKITTVFLERNKHHSKVKTISFGNVIRIYLPFVYVCVCLHEVVIHN